MKIKRQLGIPLGEFLERNLAELKTGAVDIDGQCYRRGIPQHNWSGLTAHESLDALVGEFRDGYSYQLTKRLVYRIYRSREGNFVSVTTREADWFDENGNPLKY